VFLDLRFVGDFPPFVTISILITLPAACSAALTGAGTVLIETSSSDGGRQVLHLNLLLNHKRRSSGQRQTIVINDFMSTSVVPGT
jgi:hypothetical protein